MTALAPFATRHAKSAMVASVDHLASEAGVAILRAGGGAADAAIAASAVLAVTAPDMCGPGGDLFALVHRDGDERPLALNASGRAGSGADPDRLRATGLTQMPESGEVCAAPVPGCVDGWLALHARCGRAELADLLEPARCYAADGFPASPGLAAALALVPGHPEAVEAAGGGTVRAGDLVRRPGLARVLGAVAREGRAGFYGGRAGEALLALGSGEYAPEDLARPSADWVAPLEVEAWGRRLWTVPPNSQGYLTLAGAWMADRLELPGPGDGLWAHLLVEAARQAAQDRDDVLHEGADGAALLAPDRLAGRLAAIDRGRATSAPAPAPGRAGDTIALGAVDADGLGVSLIQSNFASWGTRLALPGTGVFLHNRGSSFSLAPGHPAEYGPGRRPPHTLSPAVVTGAQGALHAVVGTRGGHSQPQIMLQLLARHLGAGQDPGETLAAPRWVLAGDRVGVEDHAPGAWLAGLGARGHRITRLPGWTADVGHAYLIATDGGRPAGAADPRSLVGAATGF